MRRTQRGFFLNPYRFSGSAILDGETTGLLLAASTRRLLSSYSGAAARQAGGAAIEFSNTSAVQIDRLYDQSINANHLVQNLASHRPSTSAGGASVVMGGNSGTNWGYLESQNDTPGDHSVMTVYLVHDRFDAGGTTRIYWELGYGTAAQAGRFYQEPTDKLTIAAIGSPNSALRANQATDATLVRRISCSVIDRNEEAITDMCRLYKNGVLQASSGTGTSGTKPASNFVNAKLVVGARASGPTFGSQCTIWAFVAYRVKHDAATVARISDKLALLP